MLHIDTDVTAIRQFNIQRKLASKRLDITLQRRNFNFVTAFLQIRDRGL